jgi:selenocysteine-specific elongation factor
MSASSFHEGSTADDKSAVDEVSAATRHFVLGTAGHIDHGKTALVKALTGIDADRLKEEKQRGITIELGFAFLDGPAVRVSIVDVPGHERFVRAMAAGAAGMDAVMLVVAADEGVMPQTREHLAICNLLGMTTGFVALTKVDLVDDEWLELVREDLKEHLKDTFLADRPVICCSAKSGRGIEQVKQHIFALTDAVAERSAAGFARLPLDRVFSLKGYGTVVTGTLISGQLAAGQDVISLPSRKRGKIRSIQVHGQARKHVDAGQRVALNLKGIDKDAIARGEVLVGNDLIAPTRRFDAVVSHLAWNRNPLKRRKPFSLLSGTTQSEAMVFPLEAKTVEPGGRAPVQIDVKTPVVLFAGDRFIMQGFELNPQHGATIGGGIVIRPHPRRKRKPDPDYAAFLRTLMRATADERIEKEIAATGLRGAETQWLVTQLPYTPSETEEIISRLVAENRLVIFDREKKATVHPSVLAELETRIQTELHRLSEQSPMSAAFPRQELYTKLPARVPAKLFRCALDRLVERGVLKVQKENVGFVETKHAAAQSKLSAQVLQMLEAGALSPPRPPEIAAALAVPQRHVRDVIDQLVRDGRVFRAPDDLYFHHHPVADIKAKLVTFLKEHGQIEPLQFKEMCGVTRKYLIPLAEMFDDLQVTLRSGNVRRLRQSGK